MNSFALVNGLLFGIVHYHVLLLFLGNKVFILETNEL